MLLMACPILAQAVQIEREPTAMPGKMISIPERFKSYSGVRNLASLGDLFANPHSAGIIQLPKIAVTDGVSSIEIELKLKTDAAFAPNFAGKAAKLVSISHPVSDKWIVTVLPDKGAWKSSLFILNGTIVVEVPLVVTPPLPSGTVPDEKVFFKDRDGSLGAITRDLNGDGRLDYLDDYIFIANYLVRKPFVSSSNEPEKGEISSSSSASPASQNPGSGPGIDPNSGVGIKPVLDVDRYSPASRNERARKMKEQLK